MGTPAMAPTNTKDSDTPGWLHRHGTSVLGTVARQACKQPIYTLVITALLATMIYTSLLEGSLYNANLARPSKSHLNQFDVTDFLQGSRSLRLGKATAWRWETDDESMSDQEVASHLALITLVFPTSENDPGISAVQESVISDLAAAQLVSRTPSVLSSTLSETSITLSVPYNHLEEVLRKTQNFPKPQGEPSWTLKNAGKGNSGPKLRLWLIDFLASFVDLIKHAQIVDIIIMLLAYLAMYLTFLSLFMSMRRLGSRFWLAFSVLLSGFFSLFFGLKVTASSGVSTSMIILSECLPILVIIVGFEKPIRLTRAVLHAATESHLSAKPMARRSIPDAIEVAIKREGWRIVRDYAIEIAFLAAGAASRVQGALPQFCFLAAWILLFDSLLLFTFYISVLCVKLEVTRIRKHVKPHRALEDDGMTTGNQDFDSRVFGCKVKAANVSRFKFLMVGGFVLFNVLQLSSLSYGNVRVLDWMPYLSSLSNILMPAPINPYRVARNGLEDIYVASRASNIETRVTVLPPIKYVLQSQTEHCRDNLAGPLCDTLRGRTLGGVLAWLEDPVISKWVIAALFLSLVLNSYLMKAARWNLREREVIPDSSSATVSQSKDSSNEPEKTMSGPSELTDSRKSEQVDAMLQEGRESLLEDEEIINLCLRGKIPGHALEKTMEPFTRAVKIRRAVVSRTPSTLDVASDLEYSKAPFENYDYTLVHGACCENVIGYLPLPVGVAGPLVIDGRNYFIPMATTEGVLVASASRGCKAINAGGGAVTVINADGMTRGPCLAFSSLSRAAEAKQWIDSDKGKKILTTAFNSTSRFARLQGLKSAQAGTYLYVRFKSTTGDAMGMNMISKGVEKALEVMKEHGFSDMSTISVTGNYCVDKKSAAINWIDGRGKSVVAEALIPGDAVRSVLKTDVDALVELNTAKNLVGSAMAGSIGGFNAHASNLVAAVFLATGQDPAQNVESSSCITIMKNVNNNLHISVSMPCIEVGTIGGGTILEAQAAMLDLLGVRGAHATNPGDNARQLARIVAATVLAGELSTCAALAAGHLVSAHMAHNRSKAAAKTG
ncbi:HMG-CoA reductase [Aspergillus fischeri NRRL 181]|uniref:3-hydroxy-3-methylglutaryl coenzyme A reductase n=1 Tax=Neosartorya fischeri (strain ATCC 1020 / DSM 3700 / CBS 544.65 / FGSC A1164 / JCM 1740 / NRRL 181 / WB 181) TaxID=331117 RepID=A1D2V6_NEOFI|nr:hmg-CoA reductase [Aspergillus fischeri NRRL 181]EAW22749.1 hmg-CoA reductase [Aspergillus fischeri NRRL 181]